MYDRARLFGHPFVSSPSPAAAAGVAIPPAAQRDVFANEQHIFYDDSATRRALGIEWLSLIHI